jgi:DNA-binding LacI/PurR family transcriptional regulator
MSNKSWKLIAAEVVRRIDSGELAAGARLPSGDEIAEEWGVSRHTAHRAIEELQRVGMVIRQRRWGTVVASRQQPKVGRVGFLVDHFAQDYGFPSGDLIRGLQDALGEDYQLLIAESKSDADTEIRQIRRLHDQVDGLILYPTCHPRSTPAIQRLIESQVPMVVLDRIPEGVVPDAVVSDNEGATLEAIRTMAERGHRRIGFFSFNKPDFSTVRERHAGYRRALAEVGVEDASELTRWFSRELEDNPQGFVQSTYDALFTLMNHRDPVTALFCVQDSVAASVLQVFDQMRLSTSERLEIATFNDWPPMMLRTPWCTHRIVQRSYEIGRSAAEMLLDRMTGRRAEPTTVRVSADFFIADAGLQLASTSP